MAGRRRAAGAARAGCSKAGLIAALLLVLCYTRALASPSRRRRDLTQQQPQALLSREGDDDFDFFFLVRQYPPTFCNDHHCTHSPPRGFAFTIHGLWPQRADGSWPEFCAGPQGGPSGGLSLWRLRDLLPRMARAWPSWYGSDRQFWQHEWARHGACAAPALAAESDKPLEPGKGQHAFFAAALDLHARYSVESALSSSGIEPSESRRFPVADVVEAVRKAHGVRPHVTCDPAGNLAEVWYCVAKDGKGAVDCGGSGDGGGGVAALEAALEARRRRHAEEENSTGTPTPPSNAYCRTVMLPPPARSSGGGREQEAAEAIEQDAPMVVLAASVVAAALSALAAAVRRNGEASTASSLRRPLTSAV